MGSKLLTALLSSAAIMAVNATTAQAQDALPKSPDQASTSQAQAPTADAAPTNRGAGLDEVVVTATRTGETKAQRTPLAITVLSADRLNSSLAINVKDLVQFTPNLNVAQVTASAVIYIRGIGSNNVFAGSDPDVTVQSDGVYIARAFGQFADFVDVQRIEVLRGPQGTLYGRNAVGGTINIISRLPTDESHAKVQVTGGNYGFLQAQTYLSGPLIPGKLQASLATNYIRHDDYIQNIVPGKKGVANANRGGIRGQLRFESTENIEAITRADYNVGRERFDSYDHLLYPVPAAPLATSIIGDYTKVALDNSQLNHTELWGISEEINFHLSKSLSLKSLTAFRHSSYDLTADVDGTEINAQGSVQAETSRQFSQEFDLTANLPRFNGVLGAFYFHDHDSSIIQSINPQGPLTPAARAVFVLDRPESYASSVAAFAQGTYRIFDGLSATVGVRYTRDTKSLDANFQRTSLNPATPGVSAPGFPFFASTTRHYSSVTPKFGLDYQVTPSVLVYGSVTRGYKSGGTNYAATTISALTFNPENIWSYEGGLKSEFFDHRLRLNISGFKYDYTDLQVQSLIGPGVVAIGNAATAKVKGLEIEASAKPVPPLVLTANFSLLRSNYERFTNASVPNQLLAFVRTDPRYTAATNTFDASGNVLNASPRESFSGSAQYDFGVGPGKAFIRGEVYHQTKVFYDPSNAPITAQKAYTLVNASIGYNTADSLWSIQAVAKNLTYTHYLITIAANGQVPAGLAGAPRTFAVQLTRSW